MLNATRKKSLVKESRVFSSVWQKGWGLMFRLRAPEYAVVFPFSRPEKVGIHMWFVFFPLDILWLDKKGLVQEAKTLRPWSFFRPTQKSSCVLELPVGTIKRSGTKKGDLIKLKK